MARSFWPLVQISAQMSPATIYSATELAVLAGILNQYYLLKINLFTFLLEMWSLMGPSKSYPIRSFGISV